MSLFQISVLKQHLNLQDQDVLAKAYKKYTKYFLNPTIQENIRSSKEEEYQGIFLTELFVNILGYTLKPNANFNLVAEYKNQTNSRKADGAILHNDIAIGVIELKGTNTKDLESIRKQAFDYKANQKGCVYVITSNFEKLRFYINDATEFEEFNLFEMTLERFALLYLCLEINNIINHVPLKIKESSLVIEEQITKQFYKDYSLFKRELYRDLVKRNAKRLKQNRNAISESDVILTESQKAEQLQLEKNVKLTLFKKSQKLIDRYLFIFFAEDRGLLPPNSTQQILDKWKADLDFGDERPLYDLFKQYFNFLDQGRKGTASRAEIYAYNGGLFKEDTLLDGIEIDSELLYKYTNLLAAYDFESQVDVNILGHIFENSLNEIESVNAEIEGGDFDKQKSKRKKDGVFYTPKYITKYIVENTIGKLCNEKKTELGFKEDEYFKGRKNRNKSTIEKLVHTLDVYRDWLLELTICDPACGSGAFLNQALNFLIAEHSYIDELKTKVLGGGLQFPDIENTILENNIYGVDLNEESVEIAKLSLWLRTAQPRRKLNDLSSNIKCGNSLIDSKAVAGDKAFNWETAFPKVFKEKNKKAYHITTAIHDSRTSARMVKYKVREKRDLGTNPYPNVVYFTPEDDMLITQTIANIVKEDQLNLLAYNICADHIHLLLVCDINDIPAIMQKIKGRTSYHKGLNKGLNKGLKPLAEKKKETEKENPNKPLWQQKYSTPKEITSQEQLQNTINYIKTNRSKHELPQHSTETQQLINAMCCTPANAFKTEYSGGFDVVIGNPPYVRQELLTEIKPYLEKNYSVYTSSQDLFAYFYERAFLILKKGSVFGFISNTFDKTKAAYNLREYLTKTTVFEKYIDFTQVQIFDGATTYPVIIIARNTKFGTAESFEYVLVPKKLNGEIIDIESLSETQVIQSSLISESWSFNSKGLFNLIQKIKANFPTINKNTEKSYRGIVTGYNEAFIIDSKIKAQLIKQDSSSADLIKPFLEGRDLSKWHNENANKFLIFTRRGIDINKYSAIKDYLMQFKDRLTPRNSPDIKIGRKKGPYKWFEIQDSVDYFQKFETSKIVWPNLQAKNKFSLDEENYYINAPSVILPNSSNTILCILNSKLIWEFLKSICVVRSGGYIEVKPQYFEQIPIPQITDEESFSVKTIELIKFVKNKQNLSNKYRNYISYKFQFENLSKKLQNWHELDFGEFIKELNKAIRANNKLRLKEGLDAIPTLTKKDEFEWLELFEENKQKAQTLQTQINQTEQEIDAMVYELYGLTEEEIKIVENS